MKMLFFCLLSACVICLASCKNSAITNPVSPVTIVPTVSASPDAPPPGTPVLETPQAYSNYITDRQKKVYDYIVQMSDAATLSYMNAVSIITEAVPKISQLTSEIKAMPPYKGNDAMRDAAVALFEFYETIFSKRYHQILHYTQKGNALTSAEALQMQELSAAIITDEKRLHEIFKAKQQLFAEANNMIQQPNADLYQQVNYLK